MTDSNREIERKFLLDQPLADLDAHPRSKIRQGYIVVTEAGTEVRVRKEGQQHYLTIKEGHGLDRGRRRSRSARFSSPRSGP